MSVIAGSSEKTFVTIKIDVDDGAALAKLTALEKRLRALDRAGSRLTDSLDDAARATDELTDAASRSEKAIDGAGKAMDGHDRRSRKLGHAAKMLKSAFEGVGGVLSVFGKVLKYVGIEIVAMTAGLGLVRAAFVGLQWIGNATIKVFNALALAAGAAMGSVVAAVAGGLAAMREFKIAQLQPTFKPADYGRRNAFQGRSSSASAYSGLLGDQRLGLFGDDALIAAAKAYQEAGKSVDVNLRTTFARLGDFSQGIPEVFTQIATTMGQAAKEGKITTEIFDSLREASPDLAKAFEELAGGEKQAEAAAESGRISYDRFMEAIDRGRLKSLQPFNGALERLNDTVIGRFKTSLAVIKNDLVGIGAPMLDLVKGPISEFSSSLRITLQSLAPTVQMVTKQLFQRFEETNLFDRMSLSIVRLTTQGMPKLIGLGERLRGWYHEARRWVNEFMTMLDNASKPFSKLWDNLVVPVASDVWETVKFAFKSFGEFAESNPEMIERIATAFSTLTEGIQKLIEGVTNIKKVVYPIFAGLLDVVGRLAKVFGSILGAGGIGQLVGAGLLGTAMYAKTAPRVAGARESIAKGGGLFGLRGLGDTASSAATTASLDRVAAAEGKVTAAAGAATEALAAQSAVMGRKATIATSTSLSVSGLTAKELALAKASTASTAAMGAGAVAGAGVASATTTRGPMGRAGSALARMFGLGLSRDRAVDRGAKSMGSKFLNSFKGGAGSIGASIGATLLGTYITGSASSTSNTGQAVGGALSGAGTGAMLGSAFGVPGMLIGGGAGALLGGLTSWFGADDARRREEEERRQRMIQRREAIMGTTNDPAYSIADIEAELLRQQNLKSQARMYNTRKTSFDTMLRQGSVTAREGLASQISAGPLSGLGGYDANGTNLQGALAKDVNTGALPSTALAYLMNNFYTDAGRNSPDQMTVGDAKRLILDNRPNEFGTSVTEEIASYLKGTPDDYLTGADKELRDLLKASGGLGRARFNTEGMDREALRNTSINELLFGTDDPTKEMLNSVPKGVRTELKKIQDEIKFAADELDLGNGIKGFGSGTRKEMESVNEAIRLGKSQFAIAKDNARVAYQAFGVEQAELEGAFERTGQNMKQAGVSLGVLYESLGYVGDAAADAAVGVTRFIQDLQTASNTRVEQAQASLSYKTAVRDLLQSEPGSLDQETLTISSADVVQKIAQFGQAKLMSGEYGKLGDKDTFTNYQTDLKNMLFRLLESATWDESNPDALPAIAQAIADAKPVLETAASPFGAVQYDKPTLDTIAMATQTAIEAARAEAAPGATATDITNQAIRNLRTELEGLGGDWGARFKEFNNANTQIANDAMRSLISGQLNNPNVGANLQKSIESGTSMIGPKIQQAIATSPVFVKIGVNGVFHIDAKNLKGGAETTIVATPGPGDTSSSRRRGDTAGSRFGRTMRAHNRFNAMLPGKRLVTSGMRNFALGSTKSDHLVGAAYDLTGDNLLGYREAVNRAGGFAEMHGGNANRHLHVVPPNVGDSYTPALVAAMSNGGGSTNSYTININGANASPDEIAQAVMQQIDRRQREMRERA